MKIRLLTILLGASILSAGAARAQATIDIGPATAGPGGDTSVAVYAAGLPSNTIVGAYDVNVTFADTLALDPLNSVVYNDDAFQNLVAAAGLTPIHGITGQSSTSIEVNLASLLTSTDLFPAQNDGVSNGGQVLLFTLDFSPSTAGQLDNTSSVSGSACNTDSTQTTQLDDFNGNIINACAVSTVPEPATWPLAALGLGALWALRVLGRRAPVSARA